MRNWLPPTDPLARVNMSPDVIRILLPYITISARACASATV